MARLVIATPALSDAATMTAAGSALSAAALQTLPLADRWGAGTTPAVEIDFGVAKNIRLAALLDHNGSPIGTWRLRGASTQGGLTSAPYDSTAISLWTSAGKPAETWEGLPSILWSAAGFGSYRWWRIDIDDASAPDGAFTAGRLYLCDATTSWQPGINAKWGLSSGFTDGGTVTRVRGGQAWPGPAQGKPRTKKLTLAFESEDDMKEGLFEIQRARGVTKDILLIQDPAATKHLHRDTIYGRMIELADITNQAFRIFDAPFSIEEFIR